MSLLVSSPGCLLVALLHSSPHAGVSICTQQQAIGSPEELAHSAFLPMSCWRRSHASWARCATPPCNARLEGPAVRDSSSLAGYPRLLRTVTFTCSPKTADSLSPLSEFDAGD